MLGIYRASPDPLLLALGPLDHELQVGDALDRDSGHDDLDGPLALPSQGPSAVLDGIHLDVVRTSVEGRLHRGRGLEEGGLGDWTDDSGHGFLTI